MSTPEEEDAEESLYLTLRHVSAAEIDRYGRTLDEIIGVRPSSDEAEPVGSDGLTTDERRVCLSMSCSAEDFLRAKAARDRR